MRWRRTKFASDFRHSSFETNGLALKFMSAFGGKADIRLTCCDVCFRPKADIARGIRGTRYYGMPVIHRWKRREPLFVAAMQQGPSTLLHASAHGYVRPRLRILGCVRQVWS